MAEASARSRPNRRTASPEQRRQQLVRATIRSIAKHGLSMTTVATVSKEAGLSQGIVNLHFKSKDRLLVETLKSLTDEYHEVWKRALEDSGDSPADKIRALVAVDFKPRLCQRNKLAVWFAFWGESRSRPTYREICRQRDQRYLEEMTRLCAELIGQGGYRGRRAAAVADGLLAMTEGLWLDLLMSPDQMNPETAHQICLDHLGYVFPDHFAA
ncbi:MAG: transcriptional regulator BetI [Xanthomonadales bacterium]|nr:transcriptional regulator BetI [Xanthomonadales bacterium]